MIDYIYCCFWEVQIEKMYGDFTYFILFGVREEVFSVSPGFFYRLDPLVFGHTETFCPFPFLSVCFLFSGGEVIGDGPRPSWHGVEAVGSVSAGGPVPAGCGQETGSSDGTVDAGGNDSLLSYYFSHALFFFL